MKLTACNTTLLALCAVLISSGSAMFEPPVFPSPPADDLHLPDLNYDVRYDINVDKIALPRLRDVKDDVERANIIQEVRAESKAAELAKYSGREHFLGKVHELKHKISEDKVSRTWFRRFASLFARGNPANCDPYARRHLLVSVLLYLHVQRAARRSVLTPVSMTIGAQAAKELVLMEKIAYIRAMAKRYLSKQFVSKREFYNERIDQGRGYGEIRGGGGPLLQRATRFFKGANKRQLANMESRAAQSVKDAKDREDSKRFAGDSKTLTFINARYRKMGEINHDSAAKSIARFERTLDAELQDLAVDTENRQTLLSRYCPTSAELSTPSSSSAEE